MRYWPTDVYPYTDLHNINLGWVLETVKQCEKRIKMLAGELAELQQTVTDNYNSLQGQIKSTDTANRAWTQAQIDGRIKLLDSQLSAEIAQLSSAVYAAMRKGDDNLRAWVSVELQMIKSAIPSYTKCQVINPVTGKTSSVQVAINDLWQSLRYGGLTVNEYALWDLTADEYAAKGMTVSEYALYARRRWTRDLHLRRKRGKMPDPITGEWMPVWRVVNWLSSLRRINGLTVDEYAALGLTASDYATYGLTAYEYAWAGATLLRLSGCVTVDQYALCDLTADEYAGYDMTVQEYAQDSINILLGGQ